MTGVGGGVRESTISYVSGQQRLQHDALRQDEDLRGELIGSGRHALRRSTTTRTSSYNSLSSTGSGPLRMTEAVTGDDWANSPGARPSISIGRRTLIVVSIAATWI